MPKGSTYPDMTALTGAEEIIGVQNAATKTATAQQLADLSAVQSRAYTDNAVAGVVGGYGYFQQAGTGAAQRTFQGKMRDVVAPEDFQAVGDGVTDDTVAVQAALNSGRPVVAIVRDYVCDQLVSTTPGQIILGQGGRIIAKAGVMSNGAQLTLNADGCQVVGVRMTDPTQQGATLASATGNRNYGIQIQSNYNRITGCHIDSYQNGVAVRAGSGSTEYIGNAITGNMVTNVLGVGSLGSAYGEDRGDGIVSWGCLTSITGNVVMAAPGTDARIGIHCEALGSFNTSTYPYKDRLGAISGNVVVGHFRRGIVNEGVYNGTIVGNVVAGVSWWAIAVIESKGVTVTGNSILYDRPSSDIAGSNFSPIRGPIMVYATTTGANHMVADNVIQISGVADSCMTVQGPVIGATFARNRISYEGTGTAQNAMQIITATGVKVVDNEFPQVTGTCLSSASSALIEKISGNKMSGVAGLNAANANLVMNDNDITVTTSPAMDCPNVSGVEFRRNRVTVTGAAVSAVRASAGIRCDDNTFALAAGQTQACLRFSSAGIAGGSFIGNTVIADSSSTHYGVFFDAQTSNCFNLSESTVSGNGANFSLLTYSANVTRLIMRNNQLTSIAGYLINRTAGAETGPWWVDGNTNGQVVISQDPNAVGKLSASGYNAIGTKISYLLPVASGAEGQVCVTAGAPGTWKTYGSISA